MSSVFSNSFFSRLYHHSDIKESVFGVSCRKNVSYLDAGKNAHTLDIFRPENNESTLPLVVNIHCEGFIFENNSFDDNFCAYIASLGFCVVSIKLPKAESEDFKSLLEDVTDAFIWIEKNASSLQFDTNNAFLCADSVGANLALVSYCINQSELLSKIYKTENFSLNFKAIALSSPITELSFIKINPLFSYVKNALFGENAKENPYYICSSLKEVFENSKSLPPMYIVSSVEDLMNSQSLSLTSLLRKRNIRYKFRYIEKGKYYKLTHAFNVLSPEYPESLTVNNEMIAFFKSFI